MNPHRQMFSGRSVQGRGPSGFRPWNVAACEANLLARASSAIARGFRRAASQLIWLAVLLSLGGVAAANAQVLEISDGGDVTVHGSTAENDAVMPVLRTDAVSGREIGDAYYDAARRHGLDPGLLRAVAWTESRGRNSAISPKGAIGIMQLMPGTAAALGVDPRDPLANIDGGAAYLARQLATFRTVPLALAAYNAGPGAVSRYGGVPPYTETRRYVDSILRRWGGASPVAPTNRVVPPAKLANQAAPQSRPLPVMLIEVPSE